MGGSTVIEASSSLIRKVKCNKNCATVRAGSRQEDYMLSVCSLFTRPSIALCNGDMTGTLETRRLHALGMYPLFNTPRLLVCIGNCTGRLEARKLHAWHVFVVHALVECILRYQHEAFILALSERP